MSSPTGQTTVPRSRPDTQDLAPQVPTWALVLLWSALEPHRVGEISFLRAFETSIVGRGDDELDEFAYFAEQRPGEPFPPRSAGCHWVPLPDYSAPTQERNSALMRSQCAAPSPRGSGADSASSKYARLLITCPTSSVAYFRRNVCSARGRASFVLTRIS